MAHDADQLGSFKVIGLFDTDSISPEQSFGSWRREVVRGIKQSTMKVKEELLFLDIKNSDYFYPIRRAN